MPVSFGRLSALFAMVVLAVLCAACRSEGGVGASAAASDSAGTGQREEDDGPEYSYEADVGGMLTDTLRGAAEFGLIFNPKTHREYWVLTMRSGSDVTSGLYLSRSDTTRPPAGAYEITEHPPLGSGSPRARRGGSGGADRPQSSANGFSMIYRTGMRRSFVSQSGTVELTTANDSLLEGTFQVNMRGTASQPGEPPRKGRIRVRGSFRAEKGTVGFIFGI